MKHSLLFCTLLTLGMSAQADESLDHGKALSEKNCQSCHQSEVYTRADHKITSQSSLLTQVGRCEQSLGLNWFDDDIEDTAKWLNHNYYKFQ